MLHRLAVVSLCLTLLPAPARGDEDTSGPRAKVLFEEGMKRYNLGRFQEALAAFEQAYLVRPDPVFLFNLGQCHRQLGSWKEAAYAYRRFLGLRPDAPNRQEVEKLIADAEGEIARTKAARPPTGPIAPADSPPPPPTEIAPPPAPAASAPATAPAVAKEGAPIYKRWWLWTAVAAAVAIGAGVGLTLALTLPNNAQLPASDLGPMTLRFR